MIRVPVYFDTCAIVRRYYPNAHRDWINRYFWGRDHHNYTSSVGFLEFASALGARFRNHELDLHGYAHARDLYMRDVAGKHVHLLNADAATLKWAFNLLMQVGIDPTLSLKTNDAIHLVTARSLSLAHRQKVLFVTLDHKLYRVATQASQMEGYLRVRYRSP